MVEGIHSLFGCLDGPFGYILSIYKNLAGYERYNRLSRQSSCYLHPLSGSACTKTSCLIFQTVWLAVWTVRPPASTIYPNIFERSIKVCGCVDILSRCLYLFAWLPKHKSCLDCLRDSVIIYTTVLRQFWTWVVHVVATKCLQPRLNRACHRSPSWGLLAYIVELGLQILFCNYN